MLSPEQKQELQRIIQEQNAILAGTPSFVEKRAAQKIKIDALKKLGAIPEKA